MTTNHQISDVDALGITIRAPDAAPEDGQQAVVRHGGHRSSHLIYEQVNVLGQKRNSREQGGQQWQWRRF